MTALESAYSLCTAITEAKGPNFSVGFRALPDSKRRAIHASYAFCRLVDDLVDEQEGRSAEALRAALGRWRNELEDVYGGTPIHPVSLALADAVKQFPIPQRAFADLIQGCEEDLEFEQPDSLAALERYCDLVATPIGEMSLAIFGVVRDGASLPGRYLAHALQLTNILRDVREDALRSRVYLPSPWLEEEGVSMDDLAQGRSSRGFVRLMQRGIDLAGGNYHAAAPLAGHVAPDARRAVRLMGGIYAEILARIAKDPTRVLRERVALSETEKSEMESVPGDEVDAARSDVTPKTG